AKLYELLGRRPEADALRAVKSNYDFSNPRELGLAAAECRLDRQPTQAVSLLRRATRLDPQDFRIWFDLGICHEQLGQDAEAAAAFTTCMALRPQLPQPFIRRGM